ncbi:MAG: tetratricopeptide repeat protein [Candidatus Latescibacterota bacterium]|nr:MAG: tetratricopeptide repeat protein [Candidatus Latescibacterota bacterium]
MKKQKKTANRRAGKPADVSGRKRRNASRALVGRITDAHLLWLIVIVALAVRLVYIAQLRDAPFFHDPVGDSKIYHERAVEIAAGDLIGRGAYFHSSPFYPYFLAVIYRLFGVHLTLVRLIQCLIGCANCLLVYRLTMRVSGERRGPPVLAALFAAFYGTLVFFDGDLLMITLVLFFTSSSILLLIAGDERAQCVSKRSETESVSGRRGGVYFLFAGVLLGLAGLGKPNVLLFAPFGLLWILTGFERRFLPARWKAGLWFAVGAVVAVLPITARNYVVSRDFVLVSSNAGVNLFIGNNDEASGIFYLPPESGLDNTRLYLSSRDAAEKATGKEGLKPSEVSRYWASEALRFVSGRPGDASRLLLRKFVLFWNHYEIPNHHNRYFIGLNYAPLLGYLIVGFWLIAPLAIVGILVSHRTNGPGRVWRLYLGFILAYMGSLIPFFVTARYRLPVVPFLVVFASIGVFGLVDLLRRRSFKRLAAAVVTGALAGVIVWWSVVDYDFGFSHVVMGTAYSNLATKEPEKGPDHIARAIVHLKKSLELRPLFVDAHYNLGITYQRIGHYSGAIKELEAAVALKPNHPYAGKALEACKVSLAETGDKIDSKILPKTPFEVGVELTKAGKHLEAREHYERVLREDPHHPGGHSQLGAIYYDRGEYKKAIARFKKGLKHQPDHFVLNNNIAGAYYRIGEHDKAKRHWEKCLEIQPGNEGVLRQLKMLGGK